MTALEIAIKTGSFPAVLLLLENVLRTGNLKTLFVGKIFLSLV